MATLSDIKSFRSLPLIKRLEIISKGDSLPLKYWSKNVYAEYCTAKVEAIAEVLEDYKNKARNHIDDMREEVKGQEVSVNELYREFETMKANKDKQIDSLKQLNNQLIERVKQLEEKKEKLQIIEEEKDIDIIVEEVLSEEKQPSFTIDWSLMYESMPVQYKVKFKDGRKDTISTWEISQLYQNEGIPVPAWLDKMVKDDEEEAEEWKKEWENKKSIPPFEIDYGCVYESMPVQYRVNYKDGTFKVMGMHGIKKEYERFNLPIPDNIIRGVEREKKTYEEMKARDDKEMEEYKKREEEKEEKQKLFNIKWDTIFNRF